MFIEAALPHLDLIVPRFIYTVLFKGDITLIVKSVGWERWEGNPDSANAA